MMHFKQKCLMICLSLCLFLGLSYSALEAQELAIAEFSGYDLLFIFEDTGRELGTGQRADATRYEIVNYAAQILADDALFYNAGLVHRLGIISYNNNAEVNLPLNTVVFGPYAEEGQNRPNRDAYNQYQQDLTTINAAVINLPRTNNNSSTDGIEALGELVVAQLGNQNPNRIQHVIYIAVGVPQDSNPQRTAQGMMSDFSRFMGVGRRLDVFALPNLANSAFDVNISIWSNARSLIEGTETRVPSVLETTSVVAPFILETLANISDRQFNTIELNSDADNPQEQRITIPPFVESISFSSFNTRLERIQFPGNPALENLAYQQPNSALRTLVSPYPGEYIIPNVRNVMVTMRYADAVLRPLPSQSQLSQLSLDFDFVDIFGEVIHYANFPRQNIPAINAVVTHPVNSDSWSFSMLNDNAAIGHYSAGFIPPYSGSYQIDLSYEIPTRGQQTKTGEFSSNALQIELSQANMDNFLVYRQQDIGIELSGATNLAVDPLLELNYLTGSASENQEIALSRDNLQTTIQRRYIYPSSDSFPISFTAGLTAEFAQPNNSSDSRVYTVLPEKNFPLNVRLPQTTIRPDVDNLMLREMGITIEIVEEADLNPANFEANSVAFCAKIANNAPLPLSYDADSNAFSLRYLPPDNGTYTVTVGTYNVCDTTAVLENNFGSADFIVRELLLGFVNADESNQIPSLNQFLPLQTHFGLFEVLANGSVARYTGSLNQAPQLNISNAGISDYQAENSRYQVEFEPPQTATAQEYSLNSQPPMRFYLGDAEIREAGNFQLNVIPAAIDVAVAQANGIINITQFDKAVMNVEIYSGENFDSSDFVDGRRAEASITLGQNSWVVPLSLQSGRLQAEIDFPMGGTYNTIINLYSTSGTSGDLSDDTLLSTSTVFQTVVSSLSLQAFADNPAFFPSETTANFSFFWANPDNPAQALDTDFANPPQLSFRIERADGTGEAFETAVISPVDNVYSISYTSEAGEVTDITGQNYRIVPIWRSAEPASGGELSYEGNLEPFNFTVNAVTALYLTLSAPTIQYYYIPILPLVNPNVRTNRELRFDVELRQDADGDIAPDSGDGALIAFSDVYGELDKDDFEIILNSFQGELLSITNENWEIIPVPEAPVMQLVLRGLNDNEFVNVALKLNDSLGTDTSRFTLRQSNSFEAVNTVLQVSPLTFILPLLFVIPSLLIAALIWLGWFISGFVKHSRSPHLKGYLRFEDDLGDLLRWEQDLASFKRNHLNLLHQDDWTVLNVRRLQLRTIENSPDSVHVDLWMERPKSPLSPIMAILSYFMRQRFDPPKSQDLAPGDKMTLPNVQRFLVLADSAHAGRETAVRKQRQREFGAGMSAGSIPLRDTESVSEPKLPKAGGSTFIQINPGQNQPDKPTFVAPSPEIESVQEMPITEATSAENSPVSQGEDLGSEAGMPRRRRTRENPFKQSNTENKPDNNPEG